MINGELRVIHSLKELDFCQLKDVYVESNVHSGAENYSELSAAEQLIQAEDDFYVYLKESFFQDDRALYAVWTLEGRYVAALRLEPYRDGLLLEGLETAPGARGKGYATSLVCNILKYLDAQGTTTVYSHVDKTNTPSLSVHDSCGFYMISDHAVFVDGSVSYNSFTFCHKK